VSARDQGANVETVLASGRTTFMGIELLTGPDTLVPRAETELLGGAAVAAVRERRREGIELRVIDMCCGSGNLACAIASHVPEARVWACDLTPSCVETARRNVEHLALGGRVQVLQGDLFAPLAPLGLLGTVDVVVCNPPYISSGRLAKDRANLLEREPREAFDGGPYGLSIHQRVLKEAPPYLKPGGALLFEIGEGQARQVSLLFDRARVYEEVRSLEDAGGQARVIAATLKGT
jgi:release factor glutamine methyltransferase